MWGTLRRLGIVAAIFIALAIVIQSGGPTPFGNGRFPVGFEVLPTPPGPFPTKAEIQNDAWTLAGQIRASAGRLSNPASDGSGGSPISRSQTDNTAFLFKEGIFDGTYVPAGTNQV